MKKLLVLVFLLTLLAAGGATAAGLWFIYTPASSSPDPVTIEIPKGQGSKAISGMLARNGVVKDARLFQIYIRVTRSESKLRAGEFGFRKNDTPQQVLQTLVKGEVVLHKLTVPEGFAAKDIAALIEAQGLGSKTEFLALVDDAAFCRSLGLPADRLEGYLFPDTYQFPKGVGAKVIATTMVKHFQAVWTADWQAKAAALGLSEAQAVTLASIVEKETGDPTERPIIAGVFYNRLKKGMRLESDPTIIYGIKDYDGNIRKKDIHDPANKYNTYVIKGLPPGPIANPGSDALHAVSFPGIHDYLYFVATGGGHHAFAKTLEEHNRNVQKYQVHPVQRRG